MLLAELLDANPEAGLVLLNPGANLTRPVSGIDSSETPDIDQYVAEGTLLLTTAMVFRDDQSDFARMIEQLHHAGTAGIAIKLGRFITTVAPAVLKRASELDYPVFSIPSDTTLSIVYHRLQSHIWGAETRQLFAALDIQKRLTKMLLGSASLTELLSHLSRSLNRDVFYYDYFFDLYAAGAPDAATRPDERLAAQVGVLLRSLHQHQPLSIIDEFKLKTVQGELLCTVTPIETGAAYPSFLAILSESLAPEPFSSVIAEQAGTVFSFLAHNTRRLTEADWRSREEHFLKLLHLRPGADPALIDTRPLSPTFALADLASYQLVAIGFDASKLPSYLAERDHFALVQLWLAKETAALGQHCVLIPLRSQGHFVLLVREPRSLLPLLLQTIADRLLEHLPLALRFGVGNQTNNLETLNSAYIEATTTLRRTLEDPSLPAVQFYSSEGIGELLQFAPEDHIQHYCTHILQSLAYPEDEYLRSLRDTLEAYLDCQCDLTHTSKTLYVHRNTVRYRMTKIQNLLAQDLNDSDFTLQLRLAIFLSRKK